MTEESHGNSPLSEPIDPCNMEQVEAMDEEPPRSGEEGISTLLFDYSVENHLKAMDSIANPCGETGTDLDENEINRLSSSITFLREWKHFSYDSRAIRFYNELDNIPEAKEISSITLPQFSSATVPKGKIHDDSSFDGSSKDFVLYVGGSVWALDWCPRVHENRDTQTKCEFLAVAAHPPESFNHKIGVPLTGRGIIQIWCILNAICEKEIVPTSKKNQKRKSQPGASTEGNPRGRPRKKPTDESPQKTEPKKPRGKPRKHPAETTETMKSRGRPRKKAIEKSLSKLDGNIQYVEALAVRYPEESAIPLAIEGPLETAKEYSAMENQVEIEDSSRAVSSSNSIIKLPIRRKRSKIEGAEENISSTLSDNNEAGRHQISEQESVVVGNIQDRNSLDIYKDTSLPRVVLCVAHNGKVAWDMKWRPSNEDGFESKHRMGYLAVLLGNGSLEVWEVPLPQAMKAIYLSSGKVGTDPRFIKLAPTFRCSKLKCGETQSIPLTVEWSTRGNPDFLLAGCHDGLVALWKFSTTKSAEDTRPLLFFSADTAPIRAVAWAPAESDPESANVIATAGHGGLKFWDIRDPFHPLWDLHPVPRFIYSLDWLSDPRCVVVSFDDGTMRILSLTKAAYDGPATGKPFSGTKLQGFSVYNCSSSPIWDVHVSRLTGIAAYCSADGAVLQFQLTSKAVEKDSRYRTPHFLCGFLTMEDCTFAVHTPLPNNPIVLKKPVNESGEAPRCLRSLLSESANKPTFSASDTQPLGILFFLSYATPELDESRDAQMIQALTYGEDPGLESESEGTSTSHTSSKAPKYRTKSKDKAERNDNNLALVCIDEEQGNVETSGKARGGNEPEGFPPKMVAIHRVRWNMNKGSERWLCYGGAAGIVRCQEIVPPAVVTRSNGKGRRQQQSLPREVKPLGDGFRSIRH